MQDQSVLLKMGVPHLTDLTSVISLTDEGTEDTHASSIPRSGMAVCKAQAPFTALLNQRRAMTVASAS